MLDAPQQFHDIHSSPARVSEDPLSSEKVIAELSDSVFAQAETILALTQPLRYTQCAKLQGGPSTPLSSRRFEFDQNFHHYELSQYIPYRRDCAEIWDRTAVSTFHDNKRVILLSGSKKNPVQGKIFIDGDKPYAPLDNIHDVLVQIESALAGWLRERSADDFFAMRVLPVFDRLDGVVQGISHRLFPPSD